MGFVSGAMKPGMYPLTTLYLYLTDRCNLFCSHCWISPRFSGSPCRGTPLESLKTTVEETIPLGLQRVKLTGGEPLLYADLNDLMLFLSERGIGISVESNGTLVNRDSAQQWASCGVAQVSVSLDGASAICHDEIRGVGGCFFGAVEGLRVMAECGLNTQIIMTLQRRNRSEIPALIRLSEELGASSLKINPLIPCGRAIGSFARGENLDLHDLMGIYQEVEKECAGRDTPDIIFDLPPAFLSLREIRRRSVSECAILNMLGILANGDVSMCGIGQTIDEMRMGNIERDSVSEIWRRAPILTDMRRSMAKRLKGVCGLCIFRFQCLGSCRANAYALQRDLYAPHFLCQELFDAGLFPSSRLSG